MLKRPCSSPSQGANGSKLVQYWGLQPHSQPQGMPTIWYITFAVTVMHVPSISKYVFDSRERAFLGLVLVIILSLVGFNSNVKPGHRFGCRSCIRSWNLAFAKDWDQRWEKEECGRYQELTLEKIKGPLLYHQPCFDQGSVVTYKDGCLHNIKTNIFSIAIANFKILLRRV